MNPTLLDLPFLAVIFAATAAAMLACTFAGFACLEWCLDSATNRQLSIRFMAFLGCIVAEAAAFAAGVALFAWVAT